MSVIFLNNLSIHYESLGRGRPVLFLHSWVGSWRYWVPSMQVASGSHSTYALDLPGFGDTAPSPLVTSLEQQATLVKDFLDEMGIGRIAVVGHGLGALLGLALAHIQLARVARMMAIALPLDPAAVDSRLLSSSRAALYHLLERQLDQAGDPLPRDMTIEDPALNVSIDARSMRESLVALQEAQVPCLLLYGASDPLLLPPPPEYTSEYGVNMHQLVLPNCGHFLMLDAADTFHRLMIDFLALEPGTTPRAIQAREEWRRRIR